MSTPETSSSSNTPAKPKSNFFRLPRRDFFFGGLAGLMVGKATEWVQPLEWTQKGMPLGTKLAFAQFAEDIVMSGLLEQIGVERPTYLDIGAYEPILSNNTYLFYRRGSRGVLVEPNVSLTPKLTKTRPGDTVLTAGVGIDDMAEADYFVTSMPQLNTFDRDQAERLERESAVRIERVVKMPLLNINRVFREHFNGAPDLVSIDVEGLDLAILKTIDFEKYRPKMFCVETVVTLRAYHNPETLAFMAQKGYEIRGMTSANTIFMDKSLFSSAQG